MDWNELSICGDCGKVKYILENDAFKLEIRPQDGAVHSLILKDLDIDLIGEKRLATSFNLRLQLPDYQCNYALADQATPESILIESNAAVIRYSGIPTEKGRFPIKLALRVALDDDVVRFSSQVINNSDFPIAEFWYPRLGGLTGFGARQDVEFFWPGYFGPHYTKYFTCIPANEPFGGELPEYVMSHFKHPCMAMPFFNMHNKVLNKGVYCGYHDEIFRVHCFHFAFSPCGGIPDREDNWPTPELLETDEPIGVTLSHVRFPYIEKGEAFDSGEFVLKLHDGDWHDVAQFYRDWYTSKFQLMEKPSWLRKRTVWSTGECMQPEDRICADYKGMVQWAKDAKAFGIETMEICGWDKGGQDRDYPEYVTEERLGSEQDFANMLNEIKAIGVEPVLFGNYNAIDAASDLFKTKLHRFMRQDAYGCSENWMAWGQSTLEARTGLNVRRQVWASASNSEFVDDLTEHFVRLARLGVKALQIDKTGTSDQLLDFNPLAGMKPDVAMPCGTVNGMAHILEKCREIEPEFCLASEAVTDRYLPYVDVYYRGPMRSVSPMRYVFPEWTACQHINNWLDFASVNIAVCYGLVIVLSPLSYAASVGHPRYKRLMTYIAEVTRLREELKDRIFLSRWLDNRGAEITCDDSGVSGRMVTEAKDLGGVALLDADNKGSASKSLTYSVHATYKDNLRAIVVVNNTDEAVSYNWRFTDRDVREAQLYQPFETPVVVSPKERLTVPPKRFQVIVEM